MIKTAPVGGRSANDSLDMVAEQDRQLIEIFTGWDAATPSPDLDDTRSLVDMAYQRGTYGKLLIEHAAWRVAAKEDVARVLYNIGVADLADELLVHITAVREQVARLDEIARGVNAMGVAASMNFAGAVGNLAAILRADLDTEPAGVLPRVEAALGDHRANLRSAKWVRRHAPTHPAPRRRWYTRVSILVRVHAGYDQLRGFPWADSAPLADPTVAGSLDKES